MKNRAMEIVEFISHAGWENAVETPLRADFSSRRFARLQRKEGLPKTAILMDADVDQKTENFVDLARVLRACEISAPEIYAAKSADGLVLMEDFGDRNIGRLIDRGEKAKDFYPRAADVLIHLHRRFDPAQARDLDVPVYGGALFASQVELFLDAWFIFVKQREASLEEAESFRAAWKSVLATTDHVPQTLMLRDFMPDNLMQLPDREEWRAIGVLDFQDGGIGPIAYDIASLCEVVRRDGNAATLDQLIDYYHQEAAPKIDKNELHKTCRILAAQRHMRILGVIANRALKTGERDKLAYAPRIWDYLSELLQDEPLKPVREWVTGIFRQWAA